MHRLSWLACLCALALSSSACSTTSSAQQLAPSVDSDAASDSALPEETGADGSPEAGDEKVNAGPCNPNPCTQPSKTHCVDKNGTASCECDPGTHSESGQCVPDTSCEPTTCNSHGKCAVVGGTLVCTCDTGFTGKNCESCAQGWYSDGKGGCTQTPCSPNPCTDPDRALCKVGPNGAVCECNAGTHDEAGQCVPDVTCTPNTCSGHGVCADTDGGIGCTCDTGYAGPACAVCASGYHDDGTGGCTNDPCTPNPCIEANKTLCANSGGQALCSCDAGYHAEGAQCVIDQTCSASSCSGHGTCSTPGGVVLCTCAQGYAGPSCSACDTGYHDDGAGGCTDNPCVPNPCTAANKTLCTNNGAQAVCACDAGYHDDGMGGCSTDPCVPNLCLAQNKSCHVVGGAAECYTPVCDDTNPCTDDAVVNGVCVHTSLSGTSCSTSLCLVGQTCSSGACGGGAVVVCDDANPCTADHCEPAAGCKYVVDDSLVPDDGVGCTVDKCVSGAKQNTPSDALCDDGLYCTGVEACAPGAAGADAQGCMHANVPQPPGASSTCAKYVCDEATKSFKLTTSPGSACDDGLPCTTGDQCTTSGACVGTLTGTCVPAVCGSTTAFGAVVDLQGSRVSGSISLQGAQPPASLTSAQYQGDVRLYLRAQDTSVLHDLGDVRYSYSSPGYVLVSGSGKSSTLVPPGIYDLVYEHDTYGSPVSHAYRSSLDPFPAGFRVLSKDVVVGQGTLGLDVDLTGGRVTGTITLAGVAPPASLTSAQYQGDVRLYLLARDTHVLHDLGDVRYSYSSPGYVMVSGSGKIDTLVPPGAYDLVYEHDTYGSPVSHVYRSSTDPFPAGYRVLRENVTVNPGSNALDVDLSGGRVTGTITLGGAAPPSSLSSAQYQGDVRLYLRARDTTVQHDLGDVRYSYSSPGYVLVSGSGKIDTLVPPGTYDLIYEHDTYGSPVSHVYRSSVDPFPAGYRVLQENIIVAAGANALNVDLGGGRVTGVITLEGAAPPASLTSAQYQGDVRLYLRARDTLVQHDLGDVRYSYSSPGYVLVSGSGKIDTLVPPGAYDIVVEHDTYGSPVSHVYRSTTDLFPAAYRVLQENVLVGSGAATLDVNLTGARVTGSITLAGKAPPSSLTSQQYEGDVRLYLRAQDTQVQHDLGDVRYSYSSPGYVLVSGSAAIDTRVPPGTYDLIYEHDTYGSPVSLVYRSSSDPFPAGYRVLSTGLAFAAGSNSLNVDINGVHELGTITLAGSPPPASLTSAQYQGDAKLYLLARDTLVLHELGDVRYSYSSPGYVMVNGTGTIDSLLVSGVYDLVYSHDTYGSPVSHVYRSTTDPFPAGYRMLRACLSVP